VAPQRGRFFSAGEDTRGRDRLLVLTDAFWRSRYQADPAVVGRQVRMGGELFTVVGVAPRTVEAFFNRTDFFKPYGFTEQDLAPERRYAGGRARLLARLKPGFTRDAGLAQLHVLDRAFLEKQASPAARAQIERHGVH